jgi:hypothetical protein
MYTSFPLLTVYCSERFIALPVYSAAIMPNQIKGWLVNNSSKIVALQIKYCRCDPAVMNYPVKLWNSHAKFWQTTCYPETYIISDQI